MTLRTRYQLDIDARGVKFHGYEMPRARIEAWEGDYLVLVIPGHSYTVGSRYSLLGRRYGVAERVVLHFEHEARSGYMRIGRRDPDYCGGWFYLVLRYDVRRERTERS